MVLLLNGRSMHSYGSANILLHLLTAQVLSFPTENYWNWDVEESSDIESFEKAPLSPAFRPMIQDSLLSQACDSGTHIEWTMWIFCPMETMFMLNNLNGHLIHLSRNGSGSAG